MAAVKAKDTKPELAVRKELHKRGLRYRLHVKKLSGKPDLVFSKYKVVIFVNGCFWHNHGCKKSSFPLSNVEFWKNKIKKNKERDRHSQQILRKAGWQYIVLWECQIERGKIDWNNLTREIKNLRN